jgi:heptosyltransferase-2/heptosyltransferase-3
MTASPLHPIVIWFGRVGDMILLSSLLDILHARYGGRCHVVGAGSWPAQIYATHSAVGRVSCLHRYTAWLFDPAWWRTLRALRAARADPVYVCETDPRKLARIRRLLAFGGTDARHCVFVAPEPGPGYTHWVDRLVSLGHLTPPAFDAAGYPWPNPAPPGAPRLEVSAAAHADCAAWLEEKGWRERPLVLVQPGNRRSMRGKRLRLTAADDKAWPLERWGELLHSIHARLPQAQILLCGAPRESLLLQWIVEAARLPAVAAAELPLPRLLALCTRAHSMISVDTGPAHAAAALGLPLVVMFGAHSQEQWLPRSASGSQVLGVGGPPHSRRLDEISVGTVFAAWCALEAVASTAVPAAGAPRPEPLYARSR